MDLNAIRMFITIARSGSLSAASEQIDVSIPTLSRKMAELEKSLNVQLLERSNQGVQLTAVGQQFFEQTKDNVEGLISTEWQLKNNQQAIEGKLRISLPPNLTTWWKLISDFQQRYPKVEIFCQSSERHIDLIDEGFDFALRFGELNTDQLVAKKMGESRSLVVASPEFLAQYGSPQTPEQLANYPLISYASSNEQAWKWQLDGNILPLKFKLTANDKRLLIEYALKGIAITYLPNIFIQQEIEQGKLVVLFDELTTPIVPINLLYPRHRYPSSIMRVFLTFCEEWINGNNL